LLRSRTRSFGLNATVWVPCVVETDTEEALTAAIVPSSRVDIGFGEAAAAAAWSAKATIAKE
jgi:hypothetical protein